MNAQKPFLFNRRALARRFVEDLLGEGPFDLRSGLFLAAPRRTGKSTFLRGDLVPELESRAVIAVYVDLWADRQRDPAQLIAEAIGRALSDTDNLVVRSVRSAGITKIGPGPLVTCYHQPAAPPH